MLLLVNLENFALFPNKNTGGKKNLRNLKIALLSVFSLNILEQQRLTMRDRSPNTWTVL